MRASKYFLQWILQLPIVLLLVTVNSDGYSQAVYYWYKGEKIGLEPSTDFTGVELKDNDHATQMRVSEQGLVSRGQFGSDGKMMVVESQGSDFASKVDELKREGRIVRTFTSYQTIGGDRDPHNRVLPFDEILVKFKSHVGNDQIGKLLRQFGLTVESVNERGTYLLRVLARNPHQTLDVANQLYEEGYAEWSEPNFATEIRLHDDSLYVRQWYLYNFGQIANSDSGVDIKAPQAWYGGETGDSTIIVAVLDDGVEAHEDLPSSRLAPGWTAASGGGTGLPGTGDDHGEAVAGIIAATHNSIGVRGVAPGVKIMSIRMRTSEAWNNFALIGYAIDTARIRGADILNMSWGLPSSSSIEDALMDAFNNGRGGKGCVLVASSGNWGVTEFPANIDSVLAVGAVDMRNNKPSYTASDSGVDVVAPSSRGGTVVYNEEEGGPHLCGTCLPDSEIVTLDRMGSAGYNSTNYTKTFGMTSAAAPQVAGVAALMLSYDPDLTSHEVRYWIRQSATELGATNWDGEGRLNARNALGAIGAPIAPYCWPDTCEEEKAHHGRIENETQLFTLHQNYPNPFNPKTTIRIDIDRERQVTVTISDVLGRTVARLYDDVLPAGSHSLIWDAGESPSGVYFYSVRSDGKIYVRKLLVSK